jgi:poly [ADP-ribose] polymerase
LEIKSNLLDSAGSDRELILQDTQRRFSVTNIFEVTRPNEHLKFAGSIQNQRLLYHGSRVANFLGILSRGLLPPKYVTDLLGANVRSDIGSLGAGIYFADNATLSLGYCRPDAEDSHVYICVCEVALGVSREYSEHDYGLVEAPAGYQSALGVRGTVFEENEYVIYDARQYRLRYLVELRDVGQRWVIE